MGGVSGGTSSSKSKQQIDPVQRDYLQRLWQQGQDLTNPGGPMSPGAVGRTSQNLVNTLFPTGEAALQGFSDIGAGTTQGQEFLAASATQANPYLGGAIDALGADLSRNLSETILPSIRSGGSAAGAPGGSRAGIAEGLAAQEAQRTFGQQASLLRAQDLTRQQQAAQALTQSQLQGAAGALQGTGALYNLGFSPTLASFLPLQIQSQLLGNPTVLGRSDSDAFEFGLNIL